MKKTMIAITGLGLLISGLSVTAQDLKSSVVPVAVKTALEKKYPSSGKINWEKEKGNFEANWGGKSGEDMSVVFTPSGIFVEQVQSIPVNTLPAGISKYVSTHYKGAKIKEAGKVTDASGTLMYEAEIKGKDLIFDKSGKFIKED